MLNELLAQIRRYEMTTLGNTVICAVSGGADSMALLWGMHLLEKKLGITLEAAHFNHRLRGEESNRDAAFVADFCARHGIALHMGQGCVTPGKKGLEAAAREARYAYFATLQGNVATAHTADDNAETVLLHLVRGTGLKGLGGIAPVGANLIRPMLTCTREQVLAFLAEHQIPYVQDSTNAEDTFLRNRLRHRVMPLLKEENPQLAENLSAMAMALRQEEQALSAMAEFAELPSVEDLRNASPALRARMLETFLRRCGVNEPERAHIALAEQLVFSQNPSAMGQFPGGVTLQRVYDRLEAKPQAKPIVAAALPEEGMVEVPGLRIYVQPAKTVVNEKDVWTVIPQGIIWVRSREAGDTLTLPGGTKTVKKLMIDRKIPAARRGQIPVLADEQGVIGVYGIGMNPQRRAGSLPAVQLRFESIEI